MFQSRTFSHVHECGHERLCSSVVDVCAATSILHDLTTLMRRMTSEFRSCVNTEDGLGSHSLSHLPAPALINYDLCGRHVKRHRREGWLY